MFFNCLFYLCGRAVDGGSAPVDSLIFRYLPDLAGCGAVPCQLSGEKGAVDQPLLHLSAVRPGAKGKKSCGFTQAVADHRIRLDVEIPDKIGHDAAVHHLSVNHAVRIFCDSIFCIFFPAL